MSFLFPPLVVQDLSILLAVTTILVLVTAEFVPYLSGEKLLVSDIKKLRNVALVLGVFFLVTIALKVVEIILG